MSAKYEIVLQFALAPRDVAAYNRVAHLEEELAKPSMLYHIDGDDCTAGRYEILLHTDDPMRSLEALRALLPASCSYRAAYRERDADQPYRTLASAAM